MLEDFDEIDNIADEVINYERNCVSGISAALGAPVGGRWQLYPLILFSIMDIHLPPKSCYIYMVSRGGFKRKEDLIAKLSINLFYVLA